MNSAFCRLGVIDNRGQNEQITAERCHNLQRLLLAPDLIPLQAAMLKAVQNGLFERGSCCKQPKVDINVTSLCFHVLLVRLYIGHVAASRAVLRCIQLWSYRKYGPIAKVVKLFGIIRASSLSRGK